MDKLSLIVSILLLAATNPLSAQRKDYAYGSSIDLQLGYCASPVKVKGEAGKALAYADGCEFNFRYTYFFGRHFGAFGQIGLSGTGANDVNYFGAMHQADGRRYKYDARSSSYNDIDLLPVISFGPACRMDKGGWSMRARIGFGFCEIDSDYDNYARYNFDDPSCQPEFFRRGIVYETADYLIDSYYEDRTHFVLTPSLQVKFTPMRHFYFSAEAGMHIMPSSVTYLAERYGARSNYNPSNWVEAIYYSDNIDTYTIDYDRCTTSRSTSLLAPVFYATFGIGWEIGWNRNYKRFR